MGAVTTTLRERQAEHVRVTVLDATIAALETRNLDDISMVEIAQAAGISLRSLYRHFDDRTSLLEAAGDRLYASLEVPIEIAAPEDIASSFLEAARRLSARPQLIRALVRSHAGHAARACSRGRRVKAIGEVVHSLTAQLNPELSRHALAVLTHLCSAASWVAVADEGDLSDEDAQDAIAWAIEALVRTLREEAGRPPRKSQTQSREKE